MNCGPLTAGRSFHRPSRDQHYLLGSSVYHIGLPLCMLALTSSIAEVCGLPGVVAVVVANMKLR